jgi:hypothetical protein
LGDVQLLCDRFVGVTIKRRPATLYVAFVEVTVLRRSFSDTDVLSQSLIEMDPLELGLFFTMRVFCHSLHSTTPTRRTLQKTP